MNRKFVPLTSAVIILFLVAPLNKATVEIALGSPTTTIFVDPPISTAEVGQTFFINIKISNVVDLYGWEFRLKWNSTLLNALNVIQGPFLKQGGGTFFWPKINNTAGYILVDCTLLGDVPGVNGSGTLATVKFYAKNQGESILDLYDTLLLNSLETAISHANNDGNVTVSDPVGGIWIPVDKLKLLAPYIGLALAISIAAVVTGVFVKRRRKITERTPYFKLAG